MNNTTLKKSNEIENSTKSTFGTAKLIFKSSTFSSTKLNHRIVKSSLLTLSYAGGGVQPNFSAVGRKQHFSQSNGEIVKPLATVVSRCATTTTTLPTFSSAKPTRLLTFNCILLLCLFFSASALAQWSGSGTESSPYLIADKTDLEALASNVNGGNSYSGKYFKVTADISDFTTPIGIGGYFGALERNFCGDFDGNNKTITLNINKSATSGTSAGYAALFGHIGAGAHIHSVITGGTVRCAAFYSAGLVAQTSSTTSVNPIIIENCTNNATVTSTSTWVGGIMGQFHSINSGCRISNCENNGNITGTGYVAGIIVYTYNYTDMLVENCVNNGTLDAGTAEYNQENGGIMGLSGGSYTTTIKNCINYGSITNAGQKTAGICGYVDTNVTIINCANIGNINAFNYVGGIVGYTSDPVVIRNCYNIGQIKPQSGKKAGGIVGYAMAGSSVINCYNGGKLPNGSVFDGRIVSENHGTVQYCYGRSGTNYGEGGICGDGSTTNTPSDCYLFSHISETSDVCTFSSPGHPYPSGGSTKYTNLVDILNAWVDANGNEYYNWDSDASPWDNKGMPKFFTCTPVPDPSLSVTQTNTGGRELQVSWTATDGVSYTLYYGVNDPNSGLENVYNAGTQTSPYNALRLTNGVEYHFAIKPTGTGDYCTDNPLSSTVSATPECNE